MKDSVWRKGEENMMQRKLLGICLGLAFVFAAAIPASAENQVLKSSAVGAGVGMITGVGAGTGAVAGAVVGGVKKHNDKKEEKKDN